MFDKMPKRLQLEEATVSWEIGRVSHVGEAGHVLDLAARWKVLACALFHQLGFSFFSEQICMPLR